MKENTEHERIFVEEEGTMLLLLSRCSHVQLLVTPWTAAYQAPPSMGFSRKNYWSRVPLPSPGRHNTQSH